MLIPTTFEDMDEKLKLAQKVVDLVDQAMRKTCVTLQRYIMGKPDTTYHHVRSFKMKKEDEKFEQFFCLRYNFEENVYLLDVMNFGQS